MSAQWDKSIAFLSIICRCCAHGTPGTEVNVPVNICAENILFGCSKVTATLCRHPSQALHSKISNFKTSSCYWDSCSWHFYVGLCERSRLAPAIIGFFWVFLSGKLFLVHISCSNSEHAQESGRRPCGWADSWSHNKKCLRCHFFLLFLSSVHIAGFSFMYPDVLWKGRDVIRSHFCYSCPECVISMLVFKVCQTLLLKVSENQSKDSCTGNVLIKWQQVCRPQVLRWGLVVSELQTTKHY